VADINLSLIRRCKRRDREAFSLLLSRYEGDLFRLCCKYLGNKEDALDAVQDIFIKVFKNIGSFDESREFLPWLKRIAVNTCLNYRRDKGKKQHLSLDYENEKGWSIVQSISAAENVEEQVAGLTAQAAIREGLALLPPGPRMVLTLHYLEGFSYQEMAEILNQPLGTVKNSLFRARGLLKSVLLRKGLLEV
jgi:RNA polymerase sigma-70 factor (ECF subfamily)